MTACDRPSGCTAEPVVRAAGLIVRLDGRRVLSVAAAYCGPCLLEFMADPDCIPGSVDGFVLRPIDAPAAAPGTDVFTLTDARTFLEALQ